MRSPNHRPFRLVSWALLLTLSAACGDETEPNAPAALRLTAVTTGGDADTDGYAYSLDGNPEAGLDPNASVLLSGLAPGSHELVVSGVESNCTLSGGTTRSVSLTGGDTTDVQLDVTCQALPISHPAGVVAAIVSLSGSPYGVAVSGAGVVYAALIGTSELARGDLATMNFASKVTVGSTPPHVVFAPSGVSAYATLQTGRGLAVVDVPTNMLTTTIPLASDGFNLAVAPDGLRVYVTTADGTLYVVDPATNAIVTTLPVGEAANGLAFNPEGTVLYVSSRDAGTVVAVDREANAVTRTYPIGGAPQRVAVAPDGSVLYVANEAHGLDIVDVVSGIATQLSFGTAGYGLGLTPDGAQLYILLPDAGEVRILERATLAPVRTLVVGGRPRNVVFTSDGRTALVANEQAVVFIE
jgi:YVTN family beta-propeller protein